MRKSYSKNAVKVIEKLDKPTKQRIKASIEGLPDGDVKKLKGFDGLYRLRIGSWRIIFSFPNKDEILIEDIDPRGDAY